MFLSNIFKYVKKSIIHYDCAKYVILTQNYISVGLAIKFNFENYISVEKLHKIKDLVYLNETAAWWTRYLVHDNQSVATKTSVFNFPHIYLCFIGCLLGVLTLTPSVCKDIRYNLFFNIYRVFGYHTDKLWEVIVDMKINVIK